MKTPTPALKSQIEALSGNVAVVNPQSHIARFIFGELKGGEHKHDYAMGVVHGAIEQALKGNQRDIPEAMKLCTGKSVKARAYLAGFHVIADSLKPITYIGKLADAANAAARTQIADHARAMACEFEVAYLATIENAKVEAAFNRKAKAKTVPAVADAAPVADAVADAAPVDEAVTMDIGTSVDAVVMALTQGMLDDAEIEALRVALSIQMDAVAAHAASSPATLAFNAAMTSADPVRELLAAH